MALTTVIPNYSHGHVIGQQLEAVFSQSVAPSRIIILDDGSTDDSVPGIRQLIAGRSNAELVCTTRNAGVIAAMNEGLRLASNEYISCAAADDLVLPGLYEKSLGLLGGYPQAGFCSAVAGVELRSGETRVPLPPACPCPSPCFVAPARVKELLLHTETWHSGTTVVHRRQCVAQAGGFRPELRSYCDGFLYLVMALRHGACFVPEPLAVWRRDERGYSTATSRDDAAMEHILEAAGTLMATEFAELFPRRLRQRINRRLRFRAMSAKAKAFAARAHLPGAGTLAELVLFGVLRFHDLPIEVRSRLAKRDRKSTRLNSSHQIISYAVFCLKKKKSSYQESVFLDVVYLRSY